MKRNEFSLDVTRLSGYLTALALLTLLIASCSEDSVTFPSSTEKISVTDADSGSASMAYGSDRYLWGYWDITVDPDFKSAEATPRRDASKHWNILKFLEQGPCTNCVKILSITPQPDGSKYIEIEIS